MKVTKIVKTISTGTGKKGPWTLVEIEAGGKTARGFMPVKVGDEVDLGYNETYKNYNFKVLEFNEIPDDWEKSKVAPPDDKAKILELMWDDIKDILLRVKTLQGDIDDETAKEVFND